MSYNLIAASSQYFTAPTASVSLDEGTLVGWFAPDFTPSENVTGQFFDTDTTRYAFYHNVNFNPIQMYNDGRLRNFDSATWTSGAWSHFAFGYKKSSDTQSCWVDGTLDSGNTPTGTWGSNSHGTNLYIGRRFATPFSYFDGRVGIVASYNVLLTTAEVQQLAAGFHPFLVRPDALVAVWDFADNDGDVDYWGQNDATSSGSPSYTSEPYIIRPSGLILLTEDPGSLEVNINGSATVTAALTGNLAANINGSATLTGNIITPNPLVPDGGINGAATVVALLDTNIQHTSSTISFTQVAEAFNTQAGNTLTLTQSATAQLVLNIAASNTLTFTQAATFTGSFSKSVSNVLGSLDAVATFKRALPTEAASSTLALTGTAEFSRPGQNTLNLTQLATSEIGGLANSAISTLAFGSTVSLDTVLNLSSLSNLILTQTVDPDRTSDQTAISLLELNQLAVPITLGSKTYVILQAPFYSLQTSVVLPNAIFGDTENITSEMSLRRSMNGGTKTFVKTNKNRRLTYTFRVNDHLKSLELLEFVRYYNSHLIKLTNWKGEVWRVNMLTNPADFVQTGRYNHDVSLEFEGEKISG